MKKMILAFPDKAMMAEFILDCKIVNVTTDLEQIALTGFFSEECVDIAMRKYGAFIPNPPDFILP